MAKPEFARIRTRRETQRRIFYLVAMLGSAQFFLNGVSLMVRKEIMVALWFASGFSAVIGSVLFETDMRTVFGRKSVWEVCPGSVAAVYSFGP